MESVNEADAHSLRKAHSAKRSPVSRLAGFGGWETLVKAYEGTRVREYEGTGQPKSVRWFERSGSAPVSDPEESPTRREEAPSGPEAAPEGGSVVPLLSRGQQSVVRGPWSVVRGQWSVVRGPVEYQLGRVRGSVRPCR